MPLPQRSQILRPWNRYPAQQCTTIRPEFIHQLDVNDYTHLLARGAGCSYGDANLSGSSHVIDTQRWQRLIDFDASAGIVTAEAGITLQDLLHYCVPRGWFVPVTPGTQFVTLGGCVAANVHGKNHVSIGAFAQSVIALTICTGIGTLTCSITENSDLFWATLGGMGLTGVITQVSLQLIPISSRQLDVKRTATHTLPDLLALFDEKSDRPYHVAWLDCSTQTDKIPGLFLAARHAQKNKFNVNKRPIIHLPKPLLRALPLNKLTAKLFNRFYFHGQRHDKTFQQEYHDFFYPLDRIRNWPEVYGKVGFIQYQFCVPTDAFVTATEKILACLHQAGHMPYLAVLKRFGEQQAGPLSFPQPGFSLALDIALDKQKTLLRTLATLDAIVLEHAGRTYLAKDTHLSAEHFRQMYPQWQDWLNIKKQYDPKAQFQSDLSQRLKLNE